MSTPKTNWEKIEKLIANIDLALANANKIALQDNYGKVNHEVVTVDNKMFVQASFTDEDGETGDTFHLFADGLHKGKNMLRIVNATQSQDPQDGILVMEDPNLLLTVLSCYTSDDSDNHSSGYFNENK